VDRAHEDCRTDSAWSDPLQASSGAAWSIFYILGTLWLFLGIAHVSEDYFAQSIGQIIVEYKIPPSVAGATLMAAGSSAPELISMFAGVILGESDTSTGTVIGSAVFNQLFIIGAAVLVSPGQHMELDWRSLARDMVAYAVTIVVMVNPRIRTARSEPDISFHGFLSYVHIILHHARTRALPGLLLWLAALACCLVFRLACRLACCVERWAASGTGRWWRPRPSASWRATAPMSPSAPTGRCEGRTRSSALIHGIIYA